MKMITFRLLFMLLLIVLSTNCFAQLAEKIAESSFRKFDGNGSGWLSGKELDACNCKEYDTNGDNEVTLQEYFAGKGIKAVSKNPTTQAKPQKPVNTATKVSGSTGGKLYFRTMSWMNQYGTTLDLSWIFLGDNGMIVYNPKHGVNPINYEAELADNADLVGKYTIANNIMTVKWQNGKTVNWKLESSGGKLTFVDGGIVTLAPALPNNYRLSGQYAAGAFMKNVSSVQTLVFNMDGTFTQKKSGAVYNNDMSAISQSDNQGTYNITGNTLRLNFDNGEKLIAVIRIWDMGGGKKRLIINSSSFPQEG